MTRIIKFSTLSSVIALSVIASACVEQVSPEVDVEDVELVSGRETYINNCASCHGAMGQGGTGTQLNEGAVVVAYPDIEDQIDLIVNGRNSMPAFESRLSAEQIEAVTRYTREGLSSISE